MLFEHGDIRKTRRAVIAISVLMILANSYLSKISKVSIVGLEFNIDRESVLNGLSFGFVYLWWMLGIHTVREMVPKLLEAQKVKAVEKKEVKLNLLRLSPNERSTWETVQDFDGPFTEFEAISDEKEKIIRRWDYWVKFTKRSVVIAADVVPPLGISLVVLFKFDIVQRICATIASFF